MTAKAPAPATESVTPDHLDTREFARNMLTVGMKSQKLLVDFTARMAARENPLPLDPLNISGAMLSLAKAMSGDREAVVEAQTQWWNNFMTLWESTARKMLGGEAPASGRARARRPPLQGGCDGEKNEIFDFIKQSLSADRQRHAGDGRQSATASTRRSAAGSPSTPRQFADAFAPTNFPLTNPDVLRATIASNGENLVKGLDNLLADIERGQGELSIRQTADGFVIGENVATAPGKVVFRNQIMELLQYSPATDEVYERPLLIFPPWINKYYIIDLRPENSFVRWLVAQGYTVFLVSWVNPDADLADKGFEDYMRDGIFAALDAVERGHRRARSQLRGLLHRRHAAGRHPRLHGEQKATTASIPPLSGRPRPISARRANFPCSWTKPSWRRSRPRWTAKAACCPAPRWRAPSTCCAPTT